MKEVLVVLLAVVVLLLLLPLLNPTTRRYVRVRVAERDGIKPGIPLDWLEVPGEG